MEGRKTLRKRKKKKKKKEGRKKLKKFEKDEFLCFFIIKTQERTLKCLKMKKRTKEKKFN
jgi:hypothetical protein